MQLKIGICSAALISNDFVTSLATLNQDHYKVCLMTDHADLVI